MGPASVSWRVVGAMSLTSGSGWVDGAVGLCREVDREGAVTGAQRSEIAGLVLGIR